MPSGEWSPAAGGVGLRVSRPRLPDIPPLGLDPQGRQDQPPDYERPRKGSIADAAEPRIRELLKAYPTMPATVIAERIGWDRSIRVLRDRVADAVVVGVLAEDRWGHDQGPLVVQQRDPAVDAAVPARGGQPEREGTELTLSPAISRVGQ
jgi:hypothetical protein